ncbi:MAG: M13 family metallopeptidase [Maricaulaceae bacterium]
MKIKLLTTSALGASALTACGATEDPTAATDTGVTTAAAETNGGETDASAELAASGPELGSWGVDLSARNEAVDPGDNFFQHANGSWIDNFEIPSDQTRYGAFNVLRDRSEERVRDIIETVSAEEGLSGDAKKLADYYNSYMDLETVDALGLSPLEGDIADIQAIDSIDALTTAFGRSGVDGTRSPIGVGVGIDREDPNKYQVNVGIGGTGLPDRDYYLEDNPRFAAIREAYRAYIATNLSFAGYENAEALAADVMALETRLAEQQWPRSERRDRDKTWNPTTLDQVKMEYSDYDWDAHIAAAELKPFAEMNVSFPRSMNPVIAVVNETPLETWRAYLVHALISNHAGLLSTEIADANFEFYGKTLRGQPEQRERWKRAVGQVATGGALGEVVGRIYVERYFPESSKQVMAKLVENLREALRQRIDGLDWMGEETKAEAYKKLDAFQPRVGFPDKWIDFSKLEITEGDLVGNAKAMREFRIRRQLDRMDGPTERDEWGRFTPQTVNASYNPFFNHITFPACIHEAPFFDPEADLAVNYGAIGGVIGHEMGHGFDDQGSKTDYEGIQRDWWTEDDRTKFDARVKALASQYSSYSPVDGQFVDGTFTSGENIGDLGGLSMAYHAYKLALNGEEAPVIDGLTGDQRFFLAWAQVWKAKIREEALVAQLKSDPHSPARYRVNGVVRNMDAWYEAFNVSEDDALYLPPEERVSIW